VSVTFVTLKTGWLLGNASCGTAQCAQVWRTGDGGHSWTAVPSPPAPATLETSGDTPSRIRFANSDDGWISAGGKVWATHDGGAHWNQQSLEPVAALETSAGFVHAVVSESRPDGFHFLVATSPVHTDAWRPSATKLEPGAGPVPRPQLVLHGAAGWLVIVNRTVVGGARLQNGQWTAWKPPCDTAGTPVELAASTATGLVAFCADGMWNDRPTGERVLLSTDAGTSFRQVPSSLPARSVYPVAAATSGVWVVGSADTVTGHPQAVLLRTGDGGRTWKTVRQAGEETWIELGFTSPQQGVAIGHGNGDKLLMTFNAGQTWDPAG
jgi:photosystem II stability/assembly factor-like uncharacterized protein